MTDKYKEPTSVAAAPYEGSNDVRTVLTELRDELPNPDQYWFEDMSDTGGDLVSEHCIFSISKDRYGEQGFGMYVRAPGSDGREQMEFYLLRQLRRAYDPQQKTENMTYYARLMREFFPDLLAGDFRLRKAYSSLNSDFNYQFLDLLRLPNDHPAVRLCREFDIRWMTKVGLYGRLFVWLPRGIGKPDFMRQKL